MFFFCRMEFTRPTVMFADWYCFKPEKSCVWSLICQNNLKKKSSCPEEVLSLKSCPEPCLELESWAHNKEARGSIISCPGKPAAHSLKPWLLTPFSSHWRDTLLPTTRSFHFAVMIRRKSSRQNRKQMRKVGLSSHQLSHPGRLLLTVALTGATAQRTVPSTGLAVVLGGFPPHYTDVRPQYTELWKVKV